MIAMTPRDSKHGRELSRISGLIARGGGLFVVADESGGRVLTSSDGKTWVVHDIGYSDIDRSYFHDIEWTGKEFLLVGNSGTLLRSESGKEWSKTETGTDGDLYGIASNGKLHIAVGSPPGDCSQPTSVLVSTDGERWKNVGDRLAEAIQTSKANSSK